ncbi:helix-turn-helix domain-containing protein [Streptomyces uncialis]|nr:helix-turn-helix domain-containing protein [Streptomyces uncialis]
MNAGPRAGLHVHPSTFRYRLKRVVDISGLDLDDPQARLADMLQMRNFGR